MKKLSKFHEKMECFFTQKILSLMQKTTNTVVSSGKCKLILTLFRVDVLGVSPRWVEGGRLNLPHHPYLQLPKISCTYPLIMKFGRILPRLKKIQKMGKSRGALLINFCYIKKDRQKLNFDTIFLYSLVFLFGFFKVVLINMIAILMIPGKLTTPGLFEIKVVGN